MAQNTVFEQIIKLIPRTQFQSLVHQHDADKFTRTMDSWTWFGALLFGQMTGHMTSEQHVNKLVSARARQLFATVAMLITLGSMNLIKMVSGLSPELKLT